MQRFVRTASVASLAVALFAAGGLGVLRSPAPDPAPAIGLTNPGAAPAVTRGSLRSTITTLQDRLAVLPDDGRSYASLGLAYVEAARVWGDPTYYPKAEEALTRALALNDGDRVDALLGMGALALARHDFVGALRWGEQAAAVNPYDASVYGVIGDAQIELGRYREAFATFDRMVETRPDLASYARLAYARQLRGQVGGALRAMRLAESAAGTPQDRAWAAHQIGDLAFHAGRLRLAERSYERGLAFAPSFVPARAGLARLAWARGDLQAAVAGYRWVVAHSPLPEHVIALGDLYLTLGRAEEAAARYDLARAEASLLRASGVNVDVELALFEADHGDTDLAVREARRGWTARRSIYAADALAWALYRDGQGAEAARYAKLALRLGTADASLHYHAGMVALRLGRLAKADLHLREALRIDPHFSILQAPQAVAVLARLEGR